MNSLAGETNEVRGRKVLSSNKHCRFVPNLQTARPLTQEGERPIRRCKDPSSDPVSHNLLHAAWIPCRLLLQSHESRARPIICERAECGLLKLSRAGLVGFGPPTHAARPTQRQQSCASAFEMWRRRGRQCVVDAEQSVNQRETKQVVSCWVLA